MESKFDYMTLTLKSKTKCLAEALKMLREDLLLKDLMDKMVLKGRAGFYDFNYTYENINLLYTLPERFEEQGICIKLSSQGLDYFNRYLESYGMTLKVWLGEWRALSFGDYVSKFTRVDYAMDDITKEGETPLITLSKVFRAAQNGEICKKARTLDLLSGAEMSARMRIKYCNGEPIKGRTLYVGVRDSGKVLRFYDKRAEQLMQKKDVPKDIVNWTRCEVEFHNDSAMSVINAFLDMSDKDFGEYMCGVVNNQCRFINRDNDNVSRCSVKRWWKDFLNGCTKCFKLPHNKPARSALARAERGLRQYVRTIYTLFQEVGIDGLYLFFHDEVERLKADNKEVLKPEIIENLREDVRYYEQTTSITNYLYNYIGKQSDLEHSVDYQHERFRGYYLLANNHERYRYRHSLFMTGQEVLGGI